MTDASSAPSTSRPRMFVPAQYVAPDPRALVVRYPFATLITVTPAGPYATALPVVFETDDPNEQRLLSHLAGRNPHASVLASGQPALLVFSGPESYISPRWYHEMREVPTWNYIAVQVRGTLDLLDSDDERMRVLARTAEVMERDQPQPWTMADAPAGMVERLRGMIRAFRITIETIEGATKLNQRHPPGDRRRVISGLLRERGVHGLPIAELMSQLPGD